MIPFVPITRAAACVILITLSAACASSSRRPLATIDTNKVGPGTVVASWYGGKFHGRKTASGERYNMHKLTAAHKTLPFGTRLLLTNMANGRSVTVRINDRGPFVAGRELDVSYAAAKKLGMLGSGHARIKIQTFAATALLSQSSNGMEVIEPRGLRVAVKRSPRTVRGR